MKIKKEGHDKKIQDKKERRKEWYMKDRKDSSGRK